MKRKNFAAMVFAVIFVITGIFGGISHAKGLKDVFASKATTASVSEDQKKAIDAKIRAVLKAQEWTIYLHRRDGGKGIETDSLLFTDETVSSKNLSSKGYGTSNFGLFVNNDGSSSWETMQTNPANKDKAFLRGELRGSVMTGTVFMKPVKGQPTTLIFSTVNPATIPAAPAAEPAAVKKDKK